MRTREDILDSCDEEDMQGVMMKASLDFGFFVEKVLDKDYKWFHREWFELYHYNRNSAVMAPRGHGKTHVLGVLYSLWYGLFNERKKVMIVSPALEQSKGVIKEIKNEIYNNEVLKELQPDKRQGSWTKTEIALSNGTEIFCKPYSDNTRGKHVDRMLCDEVAYFENKDFFWTVFSPMVEKHNGHLMAISTPKNESDLIMELMSKGDKINYKTKKYSAIMDDGPLWPEEYDQEKLEGIKEKQGSLKFEREYMCNPVATGTPMVKLDLINDSADSSIRLKEKPESLTYENEDGRELNRRFFVGVDFGISDAYEAGWTVITCVEKMPDDTVVVRDLVRTKGEHPTIIENRVQKMCETWNAEYAWLDESTFGKHYVLRLQEKLPIMGIPFTRENRNELLMTLAKYFETNKIKIPYDMDHDTTNNLCQKLIHEISAMSAAETPSGQSKFETTAMFDDMVMSLALAVYGAEHQHSVLEEW